ncbi:MAG: hypothetical protein KGI27_00955 [Thaumarchaeota archaeon]|nr:hypothetical protein [Nitrososphaerota archaeon]
MVTSQEIYAKALVGTEAGFIGGLLVLAPFAAISDIGFHLSPWAFHTMIGLALGLHGLQATLFGFIAHMLTAITIGAVFCTFFLAPWLESIALCFCRRNFRVRRTNR